MKEAFIENWNDSSELMAGLIGGMLPFVAVAGLVVLVMYYVIEFITSKP